MPAPVPLPSAVSSCARPPPGRAAPLSSPPRWAARLALSALCSLASLPASRPDPSARLPPLRPDPSAASARLPRTGPRPCASSIPTGGPADLRHAGPLQRGVGTAQLGPRQGACAAGGYCVPRKVDTNGTCGCTTDRATRQRAPGQGGVRDDRPKTPGGVFCDEQAHNCAANRPRNSPPSASARDRHPARLTARAAPADPEARQNIMAGFRAQLYGGDILRRTSQNNFECGTRIVCRIQVKLFDGRRSPASGDN